MELSTYAVRMLVPLGIRYSTAVPVLGSSAHHAITAHTAGPELAILVDLPGKGT